jgi:hypothetical protein
VAGVRASASRLDELWTSQTIELMAGADVRVLVRPETNPADAVRMLRKIADRIDCDGYAHALPEDEDIPF